MEYFNKFYKYNKSFASQCRKSTFNSWNIDPHFLHILPLSTSISSENSILIFGGLNPSSILNKVPLDLDNDDFILGSTIFQYILDSGIWKYYGTMIEPRCYHACALDGQYLYITGGYSLLKRKHGEMIAIPSTDRLNLNDKQWENCANMIMPRAAHALVAHKGYLYAFGGRNSQGSILASVEMYDPYQDLWIEISSLPQPAMGLAATCIMDSVWLIGGITDRTSEDPTKCLLSNVFSFIPSLKKWCEEIPLPYACAFSSCISNDYTLWLIGGFTASEISEKENITSCHSVLQLSLSEKPKWKLIASLLYPRHALTAVLHDEYIYVLGGVESSNKCTSDKVEVINVVGSGSSLCTKMPVPIAGCTSILIVPEKNSYRYTDEASDALSTYSERINFKPHGENYFSSESSKVSSILEDVCSMNRNSHLSPKSSTKPLYTDSFHRIFPKDEKIEKVEVTHEDITEIPYDKTKLGEKDLFNFEVNGFEAKGKKKFRYRTSMEIFLSVNESDTYALRKNLSPTSKWLDFYQKFALSDEKLHKEVFQSKEPKLNLKEELTYAEVEKTLSAEEKHSVKNKTTDLTASTSVLSSFPSQHKSFMYVKSTIKEKFKNVNLEIEPDLETRKETSEETDLYNGYDIMDVKTDNNLHNDVSDESKVFKNENLLPVILLIGGEYSKNPIESKSMLFYNCDENVWDYMSYTLPEYRIYHSAVFVNNKIYIIGGFKSESSKFNENITNNVIYFDLNDKQWYDASNINHARANHSVVVLKDKIYVLGGRNQAGQILSSIEVYDESHDAWLECESLPFPVLGTAACTLEDSIYIFGGITYENDDEILSSNTAVFNTVENNWTVSFEMPMPLAFCGIARTLNSVWLFGGLEIDEDDLVSSKQIFKYDIFSRTWNKVSELSYPRFAPVTLSINEKVYIIGGHSTQDKKEVLTCELLDLTKNEVSCINSLPIGISGRTGVVIPKICKIGSK